MRVILLRDVAKIGRRGEVCEVPGGHAQNFLIPRKFAVVATEEALRKLTVEENKKAINTGRHNDAFREVLTALASKSVEVVLEANDKGHLFKSLRARDVVSALAVHGMTITEDEVVLDAPIKNVGTHSITLRSGTQSGTITVTILKK